MSTLYDVVIYEKSTRKISSIIGSKMESWDGKGNGRNTAELRVQSGQQRINERFECEMIPSANYSVGDTLPQ